MKLKLSLFLYICLSVTISSFSHSQTQPNAGSIIQENKLGTQPTKPSNLNLEILKDNRVLEKTGNQVLIKEMEFEGNDVISSEELKKFLDNYSGQKYYFSELLNLTNLVSNFYKERGYSFARAYLPPQSIKNGVLKIIITEESMEKLMQLEIKVLLPKQKNFFPILNLELLYTDQILRKIY